MAATKKKEAKSTQQAFMEKHKDKPWVSNYPPLRDFLADNDARCNWQLRLGGTEDEPMGFVEQHVFPNGRIAIVVVHARQMGWEIFTPGTSMKVDETLVDAAARLGLKSRRLEGGVMSAHTPGPWSTQGRWQTEVSGPPGSYIITRVGDADQRWDAETIAVAQADARLIAQAPAMYALLKKLADAPLPLGDDFNDLDDGDVLDARSIVAAIDGEV
jgi:hypothetical protein